MERRSAALRDCPIDNRQQLAGIEDRQQLAGAFPDASYQFFFRRRLLFSAVCKASGRACLDPIVVQCDDIAHAVDEDAEGIAQAGTKDDQAGVAAIVVGLCSNRLCRSKARTI